MCLSSAIKPSYAVMKNTCYVHQNPLKAGLPEGIDYEWSSHKNYLGKVQSGVETEFILSMLSERKIIAITEYQRLMGNDVEMPEYGALPTYQQRTNISEMKLREQKEKIGWDEVLETVAAEMAIEKEQLLSKCRKKEVVLARKRLICEAIEKAGMKQAEIGKRLQIDSSVVSRVYAEFSKNKSNMQS